jgi:hypothetical protein
MKREYFTIPEAVERWPLLTYRILRAACVASSKGKGPTIGRKLGNKWLVTSEEVERLIEHGTADKQDRSEEKNKGKVNEWDTVFLKEKAPAIGTRQSLSKGPAGSFPEALALQKERGPKSSPENGRTPPGAR